MMTTMIRRLAAGFAAVAVLAGLTSAAQPDVSWNSQAPMVAPQVAVSWNSTAPDGPPTPQVAVSWNSGAPDAPPTPNVSWNS